MEKTIVNYFTKVFAVMLVILAPIKAVLITVGFLIFLDLISGIVAAVKRKESVSSAALRRTISKMIIYQTAVITGFFIEHYLLEGSIPVSKVVAGFIGIVEFKSILENFNTILGTDVFKTLIQKLGSKNDQL